MGESASPELLSRQIDAQIARLEAARDRDKRKAKFAMFVTTTCGAGTTFLLGLSKFSSDFENLLQGAALLTSALLSVVIAWDKFFDHRRLWILSAQAVRSLYRIRQRFDHLLESEQLDPKTVLEIQLEFNASLDKADAAWDRLRSTTG